ncbi:MAG: glycosyltransferase family 1 protein, partial [Gammaproteobacteria bacterium]|nr:glycosyltransferase family 1 protein [Gammaproteobacteria bacterium]
MVNFRGPLIQDLVAKGVRVYALAPDYSPKLRARVASLGAEPVDYSLQRTGMNPLKDLRDLMGLVRVLRRLAPDATFGYFIKPVIYGSLASLMAGVPRRFSMIEGMGYVYMDEFARQGALRRVLRGAVSQLYKTALACNERVFLLNRDDERYLVGRRLLEARKVTMINGIGLDLQHYQPQPLPKGPVTFTLISRMLHAKGIEDFVAAAREVRKTCPDVRFVLVGGTDGDERSVPRETLQSWVDEGLL